MDLSDTLLAIGRLIIAFIGYGFSVSCAGLVLLVWIDAIRPKSKWSHDAVETSAKGLALAFGAAVITTIILRVLA